MPNGGGQLSVSSVVNILSKLLNHTYRMVADILNDVATLMELLAPLFPAIFLYIICIASVSKVDYF